MQNMLGEQRQVSVLSIMYEFLSFYLKRSRLKYISLLGELKTTHTHFYNPDIKLQVSHITPSALYVTKGQ